MPVEQELNRRRRVELRKSLQNPHAESTGLAEVGFQEWSTGLPAEDATDLDFSSGQPVCWIPGEGWMESGRIDRPTAIHRQT